VNRREIFEDRAEHLSALIVSDDTEFGRTLVDRWRAEHHVPQLTLASSDVWRLASSSDHDLTIIGSLKDSQSQRIVSSLCTASAKPAIYVTEKQDESSVVLAEHSNLLVVRRQDGWAGTVVLIANEALRRVEALKRAHRAERQAMEFQNHAALGRYMLDMRPGINNALTSVLGNADLLLLEPEQRRGQESREQIKVIQMMALRLNEVMQRFSSLASEMRMGETESQAETQPMSHDASATS
jgi:hypothetical protein